MTPQKKVRMGGSQKSGVAILLLFLFIFFGKAMSFEITAMTAIPMIHFANIGINVKNA